MTEPSLRARGLWPGWWWAGGRTCRFPKWRQMRFTLRRSRSPQVLRGPFAPRPGIYSRGQQCFCVKAYYLDMHRLVVLHPWPTSQHPPGKTFIQEPHTPPTTGSKHPNQGRESQLVMDSLVSRPVSHRLAQTSRASWHQVWL